MVEITTTFLKHLESERNCLVSISIFKMDNPYRNFLGYEINLERFIRDCPSYTNIRLYVDDSTEYLAKRFMDFKNLEIIKFECPKFKIQIGHTGTFGTLMRFLPFMDWPSKYKYIVTSDIDINMMDLSYFFIEQIKTSDFSIVSNIFYDVPWSNGKYNIAAGRFISRHSLPKELLMDFLEKLLNGDFKEKVSEIITYDNNRKGSYSKFLFKDDELCPYGIDELFTNVDLFNYMKSLNKQIIVYNRIDILKSLTPLYYTTDKSHDIVDKYLLSLKNFQVKIWDRGIDVSKEFIELALKLINELKEAGFYPEHLDDFVKYSKKVSVKAGLYHIIQINTKDLI